MTRSLKSTSEQPTPTRSENPVVETIKTIVMAGVLAFGIRTFVAEARYIPSSSMEPTLEINDRLIIEKVSKYFQKPQRGDVMVFNPTDTLKEQNFKDAFIKRVIGVPGDKIEVKNQQVYVNDRKIEENYIAKPPNYDFGPVTVPNNQYFVLGDNRNDSYDSHYWGFVPEENMIGRAVVRFWPLDRVGTLNEHPLYPSQPQPAQ